MLCHIIYQCRYELTIKIIMDWRTVAAHNFRTRLGFKQYDVILTKEQLVLIKIMTSFEERRNENSVKRVWLQSWFLLSW